MVDDNELLDEVRAVLHAEVADVTASPAVLAAVRRKRHRSRGIRWLIATPVTAAVVVAVVAVVALRPSTPAEPQAKPPATTSTQPAAEPVNAAHVTDRAEKALGGVIDSVIHEQSLVTEGEKYSDPGEEALYERWLAADGSAFRFRVTIDGDPVVDLSRDKVSDIFVDYRTGTYRAFPGMEPNPPQYDDVWTPKEIRDALKDGTLTVTGPGEPIDGKPTILLHRNADKVGPPMDLWIDAKTYLPVRWQWEQENSTPFDVAYLPPTPENRAQLTTVIPEGFTEER
jgi:hypothetical protein